LLPKSLFAGSKTFFDKFDDGSKEFLFGHQPVAENKSFLESINPLVWSDPDFTFATGAGFGQ
jgi:hypothetical protein